MIPFSISYFLIFPVWAVIRNGVRTMIHLDSPDVKDAKGTKLDAR